MHCFEYNVNVGYQLTLMRDVDISETGGTRGHETRHKTQLYCLFFLFVLCLKANHLPWVGGVEGCVGFPLCSICAHKGRFAWVVVGHVPHHFP